MHIFILLHAYLSDVYYIKFNLKDKGRINIIGRPTVKSTVGPF